jgi:aminoglycoside phosphotransferase (APT) family kinase protein
VTGGDGYCLHSTLAARPDTRELLSALRRIGGNCGPAVPAGVDFTHFDFQFMNLLSDGRVITGVVDLNPPPVHGDRAFDLATLAFYVYDAGELRRPILARLSSLASRAAVRAYLAHMVLRQVEWSVRHYPAAPATRHHLRLARLVLADIETDDPGRGHDVPG